MLGSLHFLYPWSSPVTVQRGMQHTHANGPFRVWQAEGFPLVIECAEDVLQRIRASAVDWFLSLTHGGIETGGVLFGTCSESRHVRILESRPIACEHAYGPGFQLSRKDEDSIASLLASAGKDPALAGLAPLGCYLSHTRTEVCLSERDAAFFDKFFPEPWQIALVVRPARHQPTVGGAFFREPDGTLRTGSSFIEFTIEPPWESAGAPLVSNPAGAASFRKHGPSEEHFAELDALDDASVLHASALAAAVSAPTLETRSPAEESFAEVASRPIPVAAFQPDRRELVLKVTRRRAALAALITVLLAWLLWAGLAGWLRPAPDRAIALRVTETDGQLHIRWNRESEIIRQARSGVLSISDEGKRLEIPLDADHLRRGNLTYKRAGSDVDVRFVITGPDRRSAHELARFVAQDPPTQMFTAEAQQLPDAGVPAGIEPPKAALQSRPRNIEARKPAVPEGEASRALVQPSPVPSLRAPVAAPPNPAEARDTGTPASTAQKGADAKAVSGQEPAEQAFRVLPGIPEQDSAGRDTPVSRGREWPRYAPVQTGRLVWSGTLRKNDLLTIDAKGPSAGDLAGALPGVPVRVRAWTADPASDELDIYTADPMYRIGNGYVISQEAGPWTGNRRISHHYDPKRSGKVGVVEWPEPANNWQRLVLRSRTRKLRGLVIEWETLPVISASAK